MKEQLAFLPLITLSSFSHPSPPVHQQPNVFLLHLVPSGGLSVANSHPHLKRPQENNWDKKQDSVDVGNLFKENLFIGKRNNWASCLNLLPFLHRPSLPTYPIKRAMHQWLALPTLDLSGNILL